MTTADARTNSGDAADVTVRAHRRARLQAACDGWRWRRSVAYAVAHPYVTLPLPVWTADIMVRLRDIMVRRWFRCCHLFHRLSKARTRSAVVTNGFLLCLRAMRARLLALPTPRSCRCGADSIRWSQQTIVGCCLAFNRTRATRAGRSLAYGQRI